MAHRGMQVHRLDRIAAGAMDDVVALCQFHQVAKVLLVARAPPALHVRAVGWAGYLCKGQVVATDADIALRVTRMQGEFGGASFNGLQNQMAVKAHALGAFAHIGTGFFQNLARVGVHEVHAHFFQNGE